MHKLIEEVYELLDTTNLDLATIREITGAPMSMIEHIVDRRFDLACARSEYAHTHQNQMKLF